MDGSKAEFFATGCNVLCGKHCSVRGGFVTVSLHFHAASYTDHGFTSRDISDVHESVVERSVDVGYSENFLSLAYLGAEAVVFFFFPVRLNPLTLSPLTDARGIFQVTVSGGFSSGLLLPSKTIFPVS